MGSLNECIKCKNDWKFEISIFKYLWNNTRANFFVYEHFPQTWRWGVWEWVKYHIASKFNPNVKKYILEVCRSHRRNIFLQCWITNLFRQRKRKKKVDGHRYTRIGKWLAWTLSFSYKTLTKYTVNSVPPVRGVDIVIRIQGWPKPVLSKFQTWVLIEC